MLHTETGVVFLHIQLLAMLEILVGFHIYAKMHCIIHLTNYHSRKTLIFDIQHFPCSCHCEVQRLIDLSQQSQHLVYLNSRYSSPICCPDSTALLQSLEQTVMNLPWRRLRRWAYCMTGLASLRYYHIHVLGHLKGWPVCGWSEHWWTVVMTLFLQQDTGQRLHIHTKKRGFVRVRLRVGALSILNNSRQHRSTCSCHEPFRRSLCLLHSGLSLTGKTRWAGLISWKCATYPHSRSWRSRTMQGIDLDWISRSNRWFDTKAFVSKGINSPFYIAIQCPYLAVIKHRYRQYHILILSESLTP